MVLKVLPQPMVTVPESFRFRDVKRKSKLGLGSAAAESFQSWRSSSTIKMELIPVLLHQLS